MSLETAWKTWGAEVLAAWVEDRPGTRPSTWWACAAPEERFPGESEPAYLRRLDLFQPGEAERCRPPNTDIEEVE